MIKKTLRYLAMNHGKLTGLYKKLCKPSGEEFAEFLKRRSLLFSIGEGCAINHDVIFTDPKYVKLGNNVGLSSCTLIGHDGAVAVFSKSTGKVLDKVGKIEIGNNVFIGLGVIILPDVKIGDNVIIAAGAVVSKDIPSGVIAGGVPAKVIGKTSDFVDKTEAKTREYPWYDLVKTRVGSYDEAMESTLLAQRLKHFYQK